MSGVPEPLGKAVVLFLTPLYLLLLASILNVVSQGNHLATISGVFIGAAALVAIIAVLKVRSARSTNRESGISIATLMLLTVGFSIYMAYISQFMDTARTYEFSLYGIAVFLFYCSFVIVITTIVLILFTNALFAVVTWLWGLFFRTTEK